MSMDFRNRLEKAIQRGQHASDARARAERKRRLTEQELQNLHAQCRIELNERIENRLRELAEHFPGFRFESIVSDAGWGARISRDDLALRRNTRREEFSRLELLIRPFSSYHVLDLTGKATVRNKELFNRSFFRPLIEVDVATFTELVDNWALEYAEVYAGKG